MSVDSINRLLETKAPTIFKALSPLGQRAFYPPDIPFQAGQARGTTFNGTIGIFTDGHGGAVPLPSIDEALRLEGDDRNRAFLYSPVQGFEDVRRGWQQWQRRNQEPEIPSTLPMVTVGLTHGLSLVADLFAGVGRTVAIPGPFWGNYRQTFALRTGAEVWSAPWFVNGQFDPQVIAGILDGLPAGEPAIALINFPSNPGGYSPSQEERDRLRESLLRIADERPLVVILDDAYTGFVFAEGVPKDSFFWQLAGTHEQLIPIKIDGVTKEFSFFGGRVGFLTFGLDLEREVASALENKIKSLVRSTIGSPAATSQMMLLQALRSGRAEAEVAEIFRRAEARFHKIQPSLKALDPRLLKPLPFNSGFFALLEIPKELGVSANAVREHLIEHHDTGVVSIGERYVRLAICSVEKEALPELVNRVERGVRELAD